MISVLIMCSSEIVISYIIFIAEDTMLLTYGGLPDSLQHHSLIDHDDVLLFEAIASIRLYAINGRHWLFPCLAFSLYLPTIILCIVSG